jgi:two-component system LytT family response regulator
MTKYTRTIIIENDIKYVENLEIMLSGIPEIDLVGSAGDVERAIMLIRKHNPDIIFLDIELNGGSGFDVLDAVKDLHFEVIFTTAFESYAIQAIKLSALDYLLKPFGQKDIKMALERLSQKGKSNKLLSHFLEYNSPESVKEKNIALYTSEGIVYVPISEIIYCKADSNYTYFYLSNSKPIIVSSPLKKYDDILLPYQFFRIHQTYLVNLNAIKKFKKVDGGSVTLSNGEDLPVSRRKKEDLLEVLKQMSA